MERADNQLEAFYTKYTAGLSQVINSVNRDSVSALIDDLLLARAENRQIFVFGNGGSASTASHMANDLTKDRFGLENLLFRIICLNDNVSTLTATGNDFGYQAIFENQLKNLLQPKDLVIAISSSGNSENILRAIEYANKKSALTYGIVGFDGGRLKSVAQNLIHIPTKTGQYGFMEDYCLILNHIISVYIYERDQVQLSNAKSTAETKIITLDRDLATPASAPTAR